MKGVVRLVAGLVLASLVALAAGAAGSSARATETFTARTAFSSGWTADPCTQPLPQGADHQLCFNHTASPLVSGLGRVSLSFTVWQTYFFPDCVHLSVADGSVVTQTKGTLHFAGAKTGCAGSLSDGNLVLKGQVPVSVTGGDGDFAAGNGHGTLTVLSTGTATNTSAGPATGEFSLALDLPNGTFDITPPTISGAVSKHVHTHGKAKRVRVTYRVTAHDAVDGRVPVACKPRSGSRFRIGHARVTCSAVDRSANTATAHFTVTVTRATG
ncbi:MAG TPA: HYR domain-containing protein [Gaiellaceae bacterium]|nr:HYR domain-containing protein [Gaiellaceae bacterium]